MLMKTLALFRIISALFLAGIFLFFQTGCKKDKSSKSGEDNPSHITDVDGNDYKTVKIGSQIWMAENLKTTRYNDGTSISNITDNDGWSNLTSSGAWAYYNNNSDYNDNYGKLYNWHAVNSGKLCPKGWHIPTDEDWNQLEAYLVSNVGIKMKSTGNITDYTGLWKKDPGNGGTNESGFTGLPGGQRTAFGGFAGIGESGFWWTSTDNSASNAWYRQLLYYLNSLHRNGYYKLAGYSCRCILD